MARVTVLGSSSAVPDLGHENTHILVEAGERVVLIDCPGSPIIRLEQAGVEPTRLTDIILTHFHPDHVSGFAPLLMSLWLLGRKEPINVYGLPVTIDKAEKMMELYDWKKWPGFFPVRFIRVPNEENQLLLEDQEIRILTSPVAHMVPTIGLRIHFLKESKVLAYSCDTEPSDVVARLADGADVLIHESTGDSIGHTSAERAGQVAAQAQVNQLYLIHYSPQFDSPSNLLEKASPAFHGPITVARDFMVIDLRS